MNEISSCWGSFIYLGGGVFSTEINKIYEEKGSHLFDYSWEPLCLVPLMDKSLYSKINNVTPYGVLRMLYSEIAIIISPLRGYRLLFLIESNPNRALYFFTIVMLLKPIRADIIVVHIIIVVNLWNPNRGDIIDKIMLTIF